MSFFFFLLRTCHQQLCTIPFARKISCSYIFVFFKLILLDAFKPAYLQTIAKVLFHAFCKVEIYLVNFFKNHFSQIVEKENWYNKFPVLVIFLLEAEKVLKNLYHPLMIKTKQKNPPQNTYEARVERDALIKDNHEKPTTCIIFNGKRLNNFHLIPQVRQKCCHLPHGFMRMPMRQ